MSNVKSSLLRVGLLSFTFLVPTNSFAITINFESDGDVLADALFLNLPGVMVTSTELFGFDGQSGLYTNVIGTYGLPQNGIVFSSGNVEDYQAGDNLEEGKTTDYGDGGDGGGGSNSATPSQETLLQLITDGGGSNSATPSQETLLQPITGIDQHFDAVQLNIEFETAVNTGSVTFFGAFGSEEWPDHLMSGVTDGFGLYVNGVNKAGVAEFNGGTNLPVNIDHPSFAAITGTELNGMLAPGSNPVLRFDVDVNPGATNNFTIILADAGDSVLDTTVYLSSLIASNPGGGGGEPVPATGATEFDPLLPIMTEDGVPVFGENGGFAIDIAQEIANQGQTVWVDPPVSVGFTYAITGGALVTSVTAPSLATVADIDGYFLNFGMGDILFAAGATYNFAGAGVNFFTLSGIETSLSLDPADPLAFPIGLTFSSVTGNFQVVVTPITVNTDPTLAPVPLPATGLLYIGAMLMGGSLIRRRQKRPDHNDA